MIARRGSPADPARGANADDETIPFSAVSVPGGAPRRYALRLLPRAERGIDARAERVAALTDPANAQAWHTRLFAAIAGRADDPRRCPIVPEQARFRRETRQFLYRPKAGGPVWRAVHPARKRRRRAGVDTAPRPARGATAHHAQARGIESEE